MINPFSPTFPVDPRFFANRKEVLNFFVRAFERSVSSEVPTPDNIAILGDWGIGKSSVLRKFDSLCFDRFKERKPFSAIVELIPSACDSFVAFTMRFIDDVERNFNSQSSMLAKVRKEIKNWRIRSIGQGSSILRLRWSLSIVKRQGKQLKNHLSFQSVK